ncbi:MAG: SDR family NAD(P)-dependent oxidoreductase [Chthoniobacterales bacterium]
MREKVAVVTGSTQGLGEATARLFAERGASGIVICGRNVDRGQKIAAELTERGCPTGFVPADLSKLEDCSEVVAAADRRFGRIDVLVNSAGITDRGTILDTSPELFDQIFDTNVRAPFFGGMRLVVKG